MEMLVREFYRTRKDGKNLFRVYSNNGFMIRKVGTDEVYEEAIDLEEQPFVYEETAILVSKNTNYNII